MHEYDAADVNVDRPPVPFDVHGHCMALAYGASLRSEDPSTKVGCVLVFFDAARDTIVVLGSGYNRFPEGVLVTPERLNNRPDKYMFTVHAEEAAKNDFLRNTLCGGPLVPIHAVSAYIWGMTPCTDCLKDLSDGGIKTVYYHVGDSTADAQSRYAIGTTSQTIINESGMRVINLSHLNLPTPPAVESSRVT